MDELIEQLRERIADPARRTSAPPSLSPHPGSGDPDALSAALRSISATLGRVLEANRAGRVPEDPFGELRLDPVRPDATPPRRPADPAAVTLAETTLGVPLPDALRQLYLDVADGGFGPGAGLLPLADIVAAHQDLLRGGELPRDRRWPRSLLPLVAADPGWTCVDASTGAVVAWDPEGLTEYAGEAAYGRSFQPIADSVAAWLADWLTSPTLLDEAAAAGGSIVTMNVGDVSVPVMLGGPLPNGPPLRSAPPQRSGRRGGSATVSQPGTGVAPDTRAIARTHKKIAERLAADVDSARIERARDTYDPAQLSPAAAVDLDAGFERVSARRLAWHVPRKTNGAPDPKAVLCLVRLGDPNRRPGTREPWLTARARDEGGSLVFALAVEDVISENESHRLDRYRWSWAEDDRSPLAERWGGELAELVPTLTALDDGRWQEALARWGVVTDGPVGRLLAGDDASADLADLTLIWAPRLAASMARLAPWRLGTATRELRNRRPMRLFGLGGVSQVRKPGIFLSGDGNRPRLSLEWSASNERVPEAAWTRPLDLNLVHAGLIEVADVPGLP